MNIPMVRNFEQIPSIVRLTSVAPMPIEVFSSPPPPVKVVVNTTVVVAVSIT